jgi:polo-like kinase 1
MMGVNNGAGALSGRKQQNMPSQRAPMTAPQNKPEEMKTPQQEEVWVKKWVDYSSKYGLGYHLSNASVGVFFNDATKIVLDPNSYHFDYIERRQTDRQDVGKEYNIKDFPATLQKKVTLLQHFRSYLEGSQKPKASEKTAEDVQFSKRKITDVVYVKKWMRTRHAIMFRLSNKVVQVNFQDHTEIMLSSETKIVTYVNKRGERTTYPLGSAMDSANLEMVKRLKYTKDILTHMLNQNGAGQMP